jgi:hypothetical protein
MFNGINKNSINIEMGRNKHNNNLVVGVKPQIVYDPVD